MAIQKQMQDESYFGMLIQDISYRVACFDVCSTEHICRESNVVAHTLGKHALHVIDCTVDLEETPLYLQCVF